MKEGLKGRKRWTKEEWTHYQREVVERARRTIVQGKIDAVQGHIDNMWNALTTVLREARGLELALEVKRRDEEQMRLVIHYLELELLELVEGPNFLFAYFDEWNRYDE